MMLNGTPYSHDDWFRFGQLAKQAAIDAHGVEDCPDSEISFAFFLENPEAFTADEEWPDGMPEGAPLAFVMGYDNVQ